MITTIPFSGFYESIHALVTDNSLESIFHDDQGEIINDDLYGDALMEFDGKQIYGDYAKEYTREFSSEFGIESLKFDRMESPRFYNYETDTIFCEISESDIVEILSKISLTDFAQLCKEKFTSRDGFISHYNPDFATWGKYDTWDHNQIGALLLCHAQQESMNKFNCNDEMDLMESAIGNGVIEDIILTSQEMCAIVEKIKR